MPISFQCPECAKSFNVRDELAGKKARCKCGAAIQIPQPAQQQPVDPLLGPLSSGQQPFDPLMGSVIQAAQPAAISKAPGKGLHIGVKVGAGAGGVVVLGLLIWLLSSLVGGGTETGAGGVVETMEDFQSDRDIELADPVVAEQQESELEDSLRAFASVVVPASQEFLDNTPLVRLFIEETITLKMSVHLRMLDSYEVNVSSTGAFSEGVINTRIESILDSDPLGRKNIKMGSTQTVPLRCKYRDGAWELEGDTLGELISGVEKAGGFNNPDEEFEARMKSFDRQIKSITNPAGL